MKEIVILGGSNGAGKTTAARVLLPEFFGLHPLLNADEIAREISPENVDAVAMAAGRKMIERMRSFVRDGQSFALETTCAGKSYLPFLKDCKARRWSISLYYLWLPTPEDSIARVARRTREGGHSIPDDVVYRRYQKGLWNMRHLYLPLANTAAIYDNSGKYGILIASRKDGSSLEIHDQERWLKIKELT